jgi:AcrR family transcriptional regulator
MKAAPTSRGRRVGSGAPAHSPAQGRVIEAALALFTEHGIGGTSLQMIADTVGVTKAAVYHQYNTKDEIVLAVAEAVLAGLEAAVTAAEAERSRARARDALMLRFLEEHEPFRRVMARVNRVLMGGASDPPSRVRAAVIASAIAGAVVHPLALDLGDDTLRTQLRKQVRKLLPAR